MPLYAIVPTPGVTPVVMPTATVPPSPFNQNDLNKAYELLYAGKLADAPILPSQAVLIKKDDQKTISLQLYAKPLANGRWAIVDLTVPKDGVARTYEGDNLEFAWNEFLKNNIWPAGEIAAHPPQLPTSAKPLPQLPTYPPDTLWMAANNGTGELKAVSTGLSIFSVVLFVGGVICLFIPGAEPAGGYLLITAGVTQAGSSAINIYDRSSHGNFAFDLETAEDFLSIAGGLAGVAGGIGKLGLQVGNKYLIGAGIVGDAVNIGANVGSGILVTAQTASDILAIQNGLGAGWLDISGLET